MNKQEFSTKLINWQIEFGRHNLPWQVSDPYKIWLSEIMLQQTQVSTALKYYEVFLKRFPNLISLSDASQDEVLKYWAGLGYYSRARNLHKASQQIRINFDGKFPDTREKLESLSGIGRSTAAAIASFAFNKRETILDGNVKRILCRIFALDGLPNDKLFENKLWELAESLLPKNSDQMPNYTQGLMDLGSIICKRLNPMCLECPMLDICKAYQQDRTKELPRKKKPIKIIVIKQYWLVLIYNKNEFLLEKRPTKGIWGGMYCVPCFNSIEDLMTFCAAHDINIQITEINSYVKHKLTHRTLDISIYKVISNKKLMFTNLEWFSKSNLDNIGLPKPLMNYLKNEFE